MGDGEAGMSKFWDDCRVEKLYTDNVENEETSQARDFFFREEGKFS